MLSLQLQKLDDQVSTFMVVLESENGELKKKVNKFMMVSVAYFSSMVSAWNRSKVLLQT